MLEYGEIKLKLGSMLFTWDDEKEKINIRKHRVDFTSAAQIFFDPNALLENNSVDEITGEERFNITGGRLDKVMFVVYVERITINDNAIIRIISAREATRKEKIRYVNGY